MGLGSYRSFTLFISSPGGLEEERELIRSAVSTMNPGLQHMLNFNLAIVSWEDLPPSPPDISNEQLQEHLNRLVDKCNFFILILGDRYGSIEKGYDTSNTERELESILRRHERNPKIKILTYFKEISVKGGSSAQQQLALDWRARIQEKGLLVSSFSTHEEFKDNIVKDLYQIAISMNTSPFKRDCLLNFWSLGNAGRDDEKVIATDVAIVYKPLERKFIDQGKDSDYWYKRFMPAIHLEDSKAIQKIEKMIRLLGYRSTVYMDSDVPPYIGELNKIFICCPRIPEAAKRLAALKNKRFEFNTKKGKTTVLKWKTDSGNWIELKSPLTSYLKLQRHEDHGRDNWHSQLSRVYARDYAVLSRFSCTGIDGVTHTDLNDFYIAGLRGLGTWGATWYLDRRYRELRPINESEDVQLLLEIEYKNGRILNVVNVSSMDENYFLEKNKIARIKKDIRFHIFGDEK